MNLNKQYTVHGPRGLIGTRLSREDVERLIHAHEPLKDCGAVMDNAHATLAHKAGVLTIIVLQSDRRYTREQLKAQEPVRRIRPRPPIPSYADDDS